jgi:Fe-S-cluster containining protein
MEMELTKVKWDGAKRTVVFCGDCSEMRAVCQAMCCREWVVSISAEEFAAHQYDAETFCGLTDKACTAAARSCQHQRYQMPKRSDTSCVYLRDNLCSIYEKRPRVCRDFQCKSGWRLASVMPDDAASSDEKPPTLTQRVFVERLSGDAIFVTHPLMKLHTIFYVRPKKEIIFVKEMVGACGKFYTRDSLDYPQLDDVQLMMLVGLFDRKEPLHQVYSRFCSQAPDKLALGEFYAIVWLLNKHNIVLDSRNFAGMLGCMGRLG